MYFETITSMCTIQLFILNIESVIVESGFVHHKRQRKPGRQSRMDNADTGTLRHNTQNEDKKYTRG